MKKLLFMWVVMLAMAASAQEEKRPVVLLHTTEGDIKVELYNETPLHRDNFLRLVREHYYDSLLFHRVIADFMIQGGAAGSRHLEPGLQVPDISLGWTLPAEIRVPDIYHRRGALAMAREPDEVNPEHRSCANEFYIVWGRTFSSEGIAKIQARLDTVPGGARLTPAMIETYRKIGGTPHLDGTYTVFGQVIEGLDIVDRIQRVFTDDYDRPVDDVMILSAREE